MMTAIRRLLKSSRQTPEGQPGDIDAWGNLLSNDVNSAYEHYWRTCREIFGGGTPAHLDGRGGWVSVRAAIPPETAHAYARRIDEAVASGQVRKNPKAPFLTLVPRPLDLLGEGLLDIFDGPLADELHHHFASHFRILWVDCYRTEPWDRPSSAWLWHIDNVPRPMAKVLLYLTDTKDNGGTTELLPVDQSNAFKSSGYTGMDTGARLGDLTELGRAHDIAYTPRRLECAAGDAIVFHTNTLHRGILPLRRVRDVLSFFVLPSRRPWRERALADGLDRLQEAPGGFPANPDAGHGRSPVR